MKKFNILYLLIIVLFISCGDKDINKMHKVHFDRDMCERCKMVVSDRKHSVQIINTKTNKSYMYDDIGCAVLWLDEENISWSKDAVIWITDYTTRKWINAKTAYWDKGNTTPMDFGFSAHKTKDTIRKDSKIYTYDEIIEGIFLKKKEKMKKIGKSTMNTPSNKMKN